MLTPRQSADNDWVRKAATSACMRRFDQDYPVPPQPAADSTAQQTYSVLIRRYGLADLQTARTWGYHLPRSDSGDANAATQPITLGQMSESARTVLTAVDPKTGAKVAEFAGKALPERGCQAELERLMPTAAGGPGGPASGGEGIVTDIKAQTFAESRTDANVVAANAAWSSCMKSRGYDISDPLHPAANLSSVDDPAPSAEEIDQAQADVACKHDTNLIGIWFAAESDRQNTLINRHADDLAKVKRALDTEVAQLTVLRHRDWHAGPPPAS
ncbi:hypothetical protein [Kitasatospora sp. NPDC088779]|uniref:hypothetical protein n=1 Tax=Kitasatospora sp. NPDC088779 TaxID=3154964 RepID=UPI00342F29FE